MSTFTTRRSLTYWAIFFVFLLAGGPILNLDSTISLLTHSTLDGSAALLAIVATAMVYSAYRKTRARSLAILAISLGGAAAFELLHECADATFMLAWMTSDPDYFMPWSWHASRVFLGLGLLVAAFQARRDNFGTAATVDQKTFPPPLVFGVFTLLMFIGGTTALLQADLPSIYYSSVGLIRLPEIISGTIFLAALLLFVRKGNWRTDSYGHWINIALVTSICAQFFCMAFSQQYLDSSFAAAHLLKVASYGAIVFGFAQSHQASCATQQDEGAQLKGLGLGVKVALLCGFIGFICVMPIAIKSAATLHEIAATNGMQSLTADAAATNSALDKQRARADADLDYLVSTKIIEGVHRAEATGGFDQQTGKSSAELIDNVSRLAQNLLRSDAEYLSFAYIDAVNGKPVFRSEQISNAGAASLNRAALEASEHELAEMALLQAQRGALQRSNILLLENGRNNDAVVRAVLAEGTALLVFESETNAILGVLILHADVSASLTSAGLPHVETSAYVVNSKGAFLRHPDSTKEAVAGGVATFTVTEQFPGLDFVALEKTDAAKGLIYQQPDATEVLMGFKRSPVSIGGGEQLLFVSIGTREAMEIGAATIGYELQQIAQINLLVAIIIGWFFARRFAKPVQEISAAAVEFGRSGTVAELAINGRDEIGMLGKSLSDMMTEVTSQRGKLGLLAAAVDSSVDSILITTIRGQVEYVNPQYLRYAGVTADEVLGKNIMELREFQENRHILSEAPAKKGDEYVWQGQLTTLRADGQMHDETVTIAPIRNSAGKNINQSMIIQDVTERRAMERNIEYKSMELQRSNRDLEQFAYVASHDLKSPLRAIEVLVSWLKEDLEGYNEGDVQENLDLLRRRTVRLSQLLDDLLAYSRAGRKIGDIKVINTREFVADIVTLISPPEGFKIDIAADMPKLTTYHAPLETVFRNLLGNAIKHSPEPAAGLIQVRSVDRGEMIEFSVQDNGTGIAPEYAKKVFKMFQTLQARDDKEGSGMGLAIVQRIIDWQGGKIWFEDGPDGKGTVFKFTWKKTPMAQPEMGDDGDDEVMSQTQVLRAQAAAEAVAARSEAFAEDEDANENVVQKTSHDESESA